MFRPSPSHVLPTTVRRLDAPLIALVAILGFFLLLIVFLVLCLVFRNVQAEHRPLPMNARQSQPTRNPIVSRLALADLLGVTNSGSSLSDIDSAAPLFFVDHHDDQSQKGVSDDVCAVCLESLENGQRARRLPCQHVYHDSCAVVWLVKADRCPICAQPVVQTDEQPHQPQQQQRQQQQIQLQPSQDTLIVITDRVAPPPRPQSRLFASRFRVRR